MDGACDKNGRRERTGAHGFGRETWGKIQLGQPRVPVRGRIKLMKWIFK